jgi:uncharacterized membrane-anchored protein YhcB (DUF1043 family)
MFQYKGKMTELLDLKDESIENLKYLVEHFRKSASEKDVVIKFYRDLLQDTKNFSDYKLEYRHRIETQRLNDLIESMQEKEKKKNKKSKKIKDLK